jgi:putative CocE/NonD family hydrolase
MYVNEGVAEATLRSLPRSWRVLSRQGRRERVPSICQVGLDADVSIPLADGAVLRAHHFVPKLSRSVPTVLVISPYGRQFPFGHLFGAQVAGQGFQTLVVSSRGTAGSTGEWRPFRNDVEDARDVVAWLRGRPWFTGRFGTIGASYLGYTQLAVAADSPPELAAMVMIGAVAEPATAQWHGGVFTLESALSASLGKEYNHLGFVRMLRATMRLARRFGAVTNGLPLVESYVQGLGRRSEAYEMMISHPDPDDQVWAGTDLRHVISRTGADVLLVSGWWDFLLPQTLDLHERLVRAGHDPRLLIGPWTHASMAGRTGWPEVLPAALTFLRSRLGVEEGDVPRVRVHVGGGTGWRGMSSWPPGDVTSMSWVLGSGGSLATESGQSGSVVLSGQASVIRYDPANPTPSRGGATLSRTAGVVDNRKIEERDDVLVFTSDLLTRDVEVTGPVSAELTLRVDGAGADVFVRLCDVDPKGVSHNVCDGILRLDPHREVFGPDGGVVTVSLWHAAHRFIAGHRIRVQVSGGSHPRFARSTGTGEPTATATELRPVTIELLHDAARPSVVALPVSAGAPSSGAPSAD